MQYRCVEYDMILIIQEGGFKKTIHEIGVTRCEVVNVVKWK